MYFLVNASSPKLLDIAISNFAGAKVIRFGGHWTAFGVTLTPYSIFFCKCFFSLTIGHSHFKLYRCIGHIMLKVLSYILCDLDPKVKVIGQKAGICDGVPSTSALVKLFACSTQLRMQFQMLIKLKC